MACTGAIHSVDGSIRKAGSSVFGYSTTIHRHPCGWMDRSGPLASISAVIVHERHIDRSNVRNEWTVYPTDRANSDTIRRLSRSYGDSENSETESTFQPKTHPMWEVKAVFQHPPIPQDQHRTRANATSLPFVEHLIEEGSTWQVLRVAIPLSYWMTLA
jgi:hypothetical protein